MSLSNSESTLPLIHPHILIFTAEQREARPASQCSLSPRHATAESLPPPAIQAPQACLPGSSQCVASPHCGGGPAPLQAAGVAPRPAETASRAPHHATQASSSPHKGIAAPTYGSQHKRDPHRLHRLQSPTEAVGIGTDMCGSHHKKVLNSLHRLYGELGTGTCKLLRQECQRWVQLLACSALFKPVKLARLCNISAGVCPADRSGSEATRCWVQQTCPCLCLCLSYSIAFTCMPGQWSFAGFAQLPWQDW